MTDVDWNFQLVQQLDWHWREQLRPRLDGLTDAEYRWEPVPGMWNVRPRGTGTAPVQAGTGDFTIDFAYWSDRNERQTPTPWLPPKGPSPLMAVNMCWNIEETNTASKSCAFA